MVQGIPPSAYSKALDRIVAEVRSSPESTWTRQDLLTLIGKHAKRKSWRAVDDLCGPGAPLEWDPRAELFVRRPENVS